MKPAPATRELTQLDSLRAQIRVNETWQGRSVEDAEALSLKVTGHPLDELSTEQAYQVLRVQVAEQPPQEPHDGFCISCHRASSLRQCINCKEGRSNAELRGRYRFLI